MAAPQPIDPEELRAANIHPVTGLATDYLNHFNEVAMLVTMLGEMPDMAEEILEWEPIDYPTHFHRTGFRDKELAVAAWEAASPEIRERFETAKAEVEVAIDRIQSVLRKSPETAGDLVPEGAFLFELIASVGGVINGGEDENIEPDPAAADPGADQAAIDALFD